MVVVNNILVIQMNKFYGILSGNNVDLLVLKVRVKY